MELAHARFEASGIDALKLARLQRYLAAADFMQISKHTDYEGHLGRLGTRARNLQQHALLALRRVRSPRVRRRRLSPQQPASSADDLNLDLVCCELDQVVQRGVQTQLLGLCQPKRVP